jgi:hypothetical protein
MFLMSLLDARRDLLELLQISTDGCRCSIQRFPVLRFVSIRMAL